MTATADRAEYTGSDDALVLTGTPQADPQVTDGGAGGGTQGAMQIAARRIRVLRASGDAVLTGDVRGNYAGAGSQPRGAYRGRPCGDASRDQHAIFYGAANGKSQQRARLWQDASQVEAPVLDFDRAAQRLTASGNPNDAAAVHAVFASTPAQQKTSRRGAGRQPQDGLFEHKPQALLPGRRRYGKQPVRRSSAAAWRWRAATAPSTRSGRWSSLRRRMRRRAANGRQRCRCWAATCSAFASGQVALAESGRQAFGEQLVYTPNTTLRPRIRPSGSLRIPQPPGANPKKSSGQFVLTGTAAAPPRLVDPVKGNDHRGFVDIQLRR